MSFLRKLVVFLAASSLTLLLYMAALTSILTLTVTPSHLKSWLRSSNVYNTVVDDLAKKSQAAVVKNPDVESSFNEQTQIAIKKAFTPEFLQASTEQFIDGLTPWLEGEAAKPTFKIDLGGAKLAFIDSFAEQARIRYASLPACTPGQAIDTSDPMNIPCQVPGFSIEAEIQNAKGELANSQEFLPNSVLTADTFTKGEGADKVSTFENLGEVPQIYQWARRAPFIFGVLALGAAAIIIFLSQVRRKGLRRVLSSLVLASVPLLVMLWAVRYGVQRAETEIIKSSSQNSGLENTGISLLKEVQKSLNVYTLVFAIGFLIIAAGLAVYLIATKSKKPSEKDTEEHKGPEEHQPEVHPHHEPAVHSGSKPSKPKPPKLVQ